MLERSHLNLIREIDRQGSLTAAANVLCLTQSALSHTIKKIETLIGTPVWQREGRNLRLTQAGGYLLVLANHLLPQFEHAEQTMQQYARGKRGVLRIGMECHPCYQWLLKVVAPYLANWPHIDVDVKQKFQFGGISALLDYEIDLVVTPDPLAKPGLLFQPVFDYEQVLVINRKHRLANKNHILPTDLSEETLITYPVAIERLDIYRQFLLPANSLPRQHKTIETTDIMLQMVASGRGVTALPGWLVKEYEKKMPIKQVRLGKKGIAKQIFLGVRETDRDIHYLQAFIQLAKSTVN
jgi:LysR family transcriptional regulator for metE and metH